MKTSNLTILSCSWLILSACAEPPPPVSVSQFMENPRLLEATMVRCGQNRAEMKYQAECLNAREAVNRLASAEESAKRKQMEAQSERKRQALRRTQQAAAEARRRALEAQRAREEAEYLGLFEQLPDGSDTAQPTPPQANTQSMPDNGAIGEAPQPVAASGESDNTAAEATSKDNTPTESDLQSIREELRRRKDNQE